MRAYKCDRCGIFYDRPTLYTSKIFVTSSCTESGLIKDLCDKCQKELEAWWNEKKEEKDAGSD